MRQHSTVFNSRTSNKCKNKWTFHLIVTVQYSTEPIWRICLSHKAVNRFNFSIFKRSNFIASKNRFYRGHFSWPTLTERFYALSWKIFSYKCCRAVNCRPSFEFPAYFTAVINWVQENCFLSRFEFLVHKRQCNKFFAGIRLQDQKKIP